MARFLEQNKRKAITLSYDDGVVQDIRLTEMLNQYGLKATFNINSELLGTPRIMERTTGRVCHYKVSPEHAREIYRGHEVAVHTLRHNNLTKLEDSEVIRTVEEDRKNLSALMGYEVVGMAYPCGGVNNDDRVAALIKKHTGVRYARTITNTDSFDPQENLFRFDPNAAQCQWDRVMEMAERFFALETDKPQIFYVWGHSYEMDFKSDNWVRMEEFCKFVSGREDIFYGTNREVLL